MTTLEILFVTGCALAIAVAGSMAFVYLYSLALMPGY